MIFTKRKLFIFLLCFLSSVTFGQKDGIATQKALWRTRADTISSNLLKESSKVDELERAVLLARLGDLWWKSDSTQADALFEKSVDTIFFYSPEDAENKRKEYYDSARNILLVIANRNQKQSNRLIKILANVDKNPENEKESNADALIKYAVQIVKENPNQAAQIGMTALRTGYPKEFYKLIWELRRNNPTLADQLFQEAFSIAKVSRDYGMLRGIQLAVLPESIIYDFPVALSAPPPQKVEVLNFFADYLVQSQISYNAKTIPSCSSAAILVSRSRNLFETLLPQKAGMVRQAIDSCLDKKTQSAFENLEKPSKELNIEELLDFADKNKDNPKVRMVYLAKAAILANNQKKYALIIKIFNLLTKEELAGNAEFWEEMRYDAAGNLAYIQYRDGDAQGSNKTLEDVPAAYRPFAQTGFVLQFSPEDTSSYSFRIGVLNEARKGFIKSENSFAEKSDYWFLLVKLYSKNQLQAEASDVFKEIVKAFNSHVLEKENKKTQISSETITKVFSPILLETQENSIFESVNLISEPESRISVNLAFLKIALQKYESLKPVPAKTKSGKG